MEEAQRAIQALNPIDRAVFAMTRAVIGNKRARSVFVMYAAGLVSYLYRYHSRMISVKEEPRSALTRKHALVLFVLWGSMSASDPTDHVAVPIKPIS